MKVREQGEKVRRFILDSIVQGKPDVVALTADKFRISRQAINKHVSRLREQGAITNEGTSRKPLYRLVPLEVFEQTHRIEPGLAEDEVWSNSVRPLLEALPGNALNIWHHGFTEIFNNAIDHSGGSGVVVQITKTATATTIAISDDGIGIFKKIQAELDLFNERQAIFELTKGKLTTDPKNHSGEGIFFTSRMFDNFYILSGDLFFSHRHDHPSDWSLEDAKTGRGTRVSMTLNNHSARTTKKIFDQYSSKDGDYGFNKTVVPVNLAKYGADGLVSRSQAKRVLSRIELFERVVFDFKGVDFVGQAFADQIFRVYANEHPKIDLMAIHMNAEVESMVKRARANRSGEGPQVDGASRPG
jgi:hypothetical protein